MVGVEGHKAFLRKMGQLDRLRTELPENAEPIVPKNWGELNTMTIAFGHGLAVAPLQAMMAVGALVNGGMLIKPTFLKRTEEDAQENAPRVVRPEVSESMRYLMRLNAEIGSAQDDQHPGLFRRRKDRHGGKGRSAAAIPRTACSRPSWRSRRRTSRNICSSPSSTSRRACPKRTAIATAAWNSGAVTGKIIERARPDPRPAAALRSADAAVPAARQARLRHGERPGDNGRAAGIDAACAIFCRRASAAPELAARDVVGVTADSRKVVPGSLFFAVPGSEGRRACLSPRRPSRAARSRSSRSGRPRPRCRCRSSSSPMCAPHLRSGRARCIRASRRPSPPSPARAARPPSRRSCARSGAPAATPRPRSARSAS